MTSVGSRLCSTSYFPPFANIGGLSKNTVKVCLNKAFRAYFLEKSMYVSTLFVFVLFIKEYFQFKIATAFTDENVTDKSNTKSANTNLVLWLELYLVSLSECHVVIVCHFSLPTR